MNSDICQSMIEPQAHTTPVVEFPPQPKYPQWLAFLARLVTFLFHPIFMPMLGMWLMLEAETEIRDLTPPKVRLGIYMLLGILIAAPVISTLVLFSFRFLRNLDFTKPSERIAPFFSTTVFYIMAYIMLARNKQYMHPIIFSSFSAAITGMTIGMLTTLRFKISMHAMGIAGVTGMLYALMETVFYRDVILIAVLLMLCGVVGAARMIRGVHTFPQILAGAAVGFITQYLFITQGWSF
jgi:hypothetical protein